MNNTITTSDITYTYQIMLVSVLYNSMTILYSSPGRSDFTIGVALPSANETLEGMIRSAAPIYQWLKAGSGPSVIPNIGDTGTIVHSFTGVGLTSTASTTSLTMSDIQELVSQMTNTPTGITTPIIAV